MRNINVINFIFHAQKNRFLCPKHEKEKNCLSEEKENSMRVKITKKISNDIAAVSRQS